jgi:hypothetical protein
VIIYVFRVFNSLFTVENIHSIFQVPVYRIYIAIIILTILSVLLTIGYLQLPKETRD